jgi:hypothetical protein
MPNAIVPVTWEPVVFTSMFDSRKSTICMFVGSFRIARSNDPPPVVGSGGYAQFTSSSATEVPWTMMS